ncbi:MAG TPA: DUF1993 domain-containing protein [Turneriella sp.]|nr:DUF1993 domain-containing protein [Turneriella sp.]HNJ66000.1 DUF1993 domain-containing protein [Turneriella sp.]
MNIYFDIIKQMAQSMRNLQAIMGKAEEHAARLKFEPDNYLGLRFFPNMLPFSAQIRILCDISKFAAAYLAEKTPPVHEDNEKTWSDYKARLGLAIAHLETYKAEDFANAADVKVSPKNFNGKYMTGHDYLICRQTPNFYFHLVTAYDLLREAGVEVGKTDYLGPLPLRD